MANGNHAYGRKFTLQWRHNEHDSVSHHQPHDCLLNRLFWRRSKKTSKLRVTCLCAGNSPGNSEFTAQMASYAETFEDVIMRNSWVRKLNPQLKVRPRNWQIRQYGSQNEHRKLTELTDMIADGRTHAITIDPIHKFQNEPVPYVPFGAEMHTSMFRMEHCGIWSSCILGFLKLVYCVFSFWSPMY